MKVLLLSHQFPNRLDPQRGIFNLQQMRALSRHCEVQVAAPLAWFPIRLYEGLGPSPLPFRDEVEGLVTWYPRYLVTPGIARDARGLQMASAMVPALARIRREYPFDVLLAFWAYPDAVAGAAAARVLNVPLIAGALGSDVNEQARYPLRRAQVRWALDRAHRIMAVSRSLRERVLELGVPPEKVFACHNGVDRERFHPADARAARRQLGLPEDGRHVLFVGFLMPAKSLQTLVQAAACLRDRGRLDFLLHVVGEGPEGPGLRAQVASLGLGETVRFHGVREHREVPVWMQAADVFCLPSIREGCPNVLLEAIASGRPVVASRVGGIPEITSEANALLVPPSDPEALAEALRTALDRQWDPEALVASVSHFDWDISARAIYDAARDALSAGPRLEGAASRAGHLPSSGPAE